MTDRFWIRSDLFDYGLLPIAPESELSYQRLLELVRRYRAVHEMSAQYYRKINYEQKKPEGWLSYDEWKAVARDQLKLHETQTRLYFERFRSFTNMRGRVWRKTEPLKGSINFYQFVIYLFTQLISKSSFKTPGLLQRSDVQMTERYVQDGTASPSDVHQQKENDLNKHKVVYAKWWWLRFGATPEAVQLHFVQENLFKILRLLSRSDSQSGGAVLGLESPRKKATESEESGDDDEEEDWYLSTDDIDHLGFLLACGPDKDHEIIGNFSNFLPFPGKDKPYNIHDVLEYTKSKLTYNDHAYQLTTLPPTNFSGVIFQPNFHRDEDGPIVPVTGPLRIINVHQRTLIKTDPDSVPRPLNAKNSKVGTPQARENTFDYGDRRPSYADSSPWTSEATSSWMSNDKITDRSNGPKTPDHKGTLTPPSSTGHVRMGAVVSPRALTAARNRARSSSTGSPSHTFKRTSEVVRRGRKKLETEALPASDASADSPPSSGFVTTAGSPGTPRHGTQKREHSGQSGTTTKRANATSSGEGSENVNNNTPGVPVNTNHSQVNDTETTPAMANTSTPPTPTAVSKATTTATTSSEVDTSGNTSNTPASLSTSNSTSLQDDKASAPTSPLRARRTRQIIRKKDIGFPPVTGSEVWGTPTNNSDITTSSSIENPSSDKQVNESPVEAGSRVAQSRVRSTTTNEKQESKVDAKQLQRSRSTEDMQRHVLFRQVDSTSITTVNFEGSTSSATSSNSVISPARVRSNSTSTKSKKAIVSKNISTAGLTKSEPRENVKTGRKSVSIPSNGQAIDLKLPLQMTKAMADSRKSPRGESKKSPGEPKKSPPTKSRPNSPRATDSSKINTPNRNSSRPSLEVSSSSSSGYGSGTGIASVTKKATPPALTYRDRKPSARSSATTGTSSAQYSPKTTPRGLNWSSSEDDVDVFDDDFYEEQDWFINSDDSFDSDQDDEADKLTTPTDIGEVVVGDVQIVNCSGAFLYLLMPMGNVKVRACSDTTIVLGAVGGTLCVEDSERIHVVAASRELQISNSISVQCNILTNSRPLLIGDNFGLVFGPYNTHYPSLLRHLQSTGITPLSNEWNRPIIYSSKLLRRFVRTLPFPRRHPEKKRPRSIPIPAHTNGALPAESSTISDSDWELNPSTNEADEDDDEYDDDDGDPYLMPVFDIHVDGDPLGIIPGADSDGLSAPSDRHDDDSLDEWQGFSFTFGPKKRSGTDSAPDGIGDASLDGDPMVGGDSDSDEWSGLGEFDLAAVGGRRTNTKSKKSGGDPASGARSLSGGLIPAPDTRESSIGATRGANHVYRSKMNVAQKNLQEQVFQLQNPRTFTAFVIPFTLCGDTKENPVPLGKKYKDALKKHTERFKKVAEATTKLTNPVIRAAIVNKFQEWLVCTGQMTEIENLVELQLDSLAQE